jgi:hypothetical protein
MKKTLRDTCIDFFKDESVKQDVREIMKPMFQLIYNEVYVYIWIIAFYHFIIMSMIVAMFFILWKLLKNYEWKKKILSEWNS